MDDSDGPGPVIPPSLPVLHAQGPPTNSLEGQPPRKRQRTETIGLYSAAGSSSFHLNHDREMGAGDSDVRRPLRDEKYYYEDGDCVIRVEDTLFKVHRFLLARDSSAFQDMFSLPEGKGGIHSLVQEGCSDENPIWLFGDSAEDFRTFFSVLYALPSELHEYHSASADIARLLTVASLTNKYHFLSTSAWAVSAIHSVTSGLYGQPTHPLGDLTRVSSAALTRILEIALRCAHKGLIEFVVASWSNRILNRGLGPRAAMSVADQWGLEALRGVAYYVQLMEIGPVLAGRLGMGARDGAQADGGVDLDPSPSASGPGKEDEDDDARLPLTQAQLTRLLSGFYSLVALWDQLRLAPPKFARPDGCTYHVHGCLATFQMVWEEAARSERTAKYGSADVVGRLRCMEEQMRASADLACALSPGCKREAVAAVKRLVKEVQEGLAERFVDLTAEVGAEGLVHEGEGESGNG